MTDEIIGYFDSADQAEPIFDPMFEAACPYCGNKISPEDVRTHSIMGADHPTRSYFYRTHRTCDINATPHEKQLIFEGVAKQIEQRPEMGI